MKALQLLKTLKDDYIHGELASDIDEAIVELEDLKNRSCKNCMFAEFLEEVVLTLGRRINERFRNK